MFKGLRTKIESEQKGQVPKQTNDSHETSQNNPLVQSETLKNYQISKSDNNALSSNEETGRRFDSSSRQDIIQQPFLSSSSLTPVSQPLELNLNYQDQALAKEEALLQTIAELKNKVAELSSQLESVIKERDESNDQNAELYQLIEKLRRNLENERETNANLQSRLGDAEKRLKDHIYTTDGIGSKARSSAISIKSFSVVEPIIDDSQPDNVDMLRRRVCEQQDLLSEKVRQLKILNQNMNDIRKALQKEVVDHNKTREELIKLQNRS